jgi:solute carrier family 27 fatty acid transporter 1/4
MTTVLAILAALSAVVWFFLGWKSLVQLILVAIVAYVAAGKWRWFYVALMTAPRDIK